MNGHPVQLGLLVAVVMLGNSSAAGTFGWDGGGDGLRWSSANNWDPNAGAGEPDADDTVSIFGNGSQSDESRTIGILGTINSSRSLSVSNGTSLTVLDTMTVGQGTANVNVTVTLTGQGSLGFGGGPTNGATVHVGRNTGTTSGGVNPVVGSVNAAQVNVQGFLHALNVGVTPNATGGSSSVGRGTLTLGTVSNLVVYICNIGVGTGGNNGRPGGTLSVGDGNITVGTLLVAADAGSASSSLVNNGARLAVTNSLRVGSTSGAGLKGVLRLAGGHLSFGSATNQRASVVVGQALSSAGSVNPNFGTLDAAGGTVGGWVDAFIVGEGTGANNGRGTCLLAGNETDVDANVVDVGNGSVGVLSLSAGAILRVNTLMAVSGSGVVNNSPGPAFGGLDLADEATLSLANPADYVINFSDPDSDAFPLPDFYWGLRWDGSHSVSLSNLVATGRIVINYTGDDYAPGDFGVFERKGRTYVGLNEAFGATAAILMSIR